ncbi:ATP/GTP-binding protein [Nocardia camponoti]|uniref:ATP/GTP-binding protein n=1 Tax=Nocardia camponoti TaxID=1616106 RepID=UPI001662CF28|nr:ATP/GTP-binding protein [Nocardia camponoti]
MPRRKPRAGASSRSNAPRPVGDVFGRTEAGPSGDDYVVRTVPGARAVKTYRCPGCDHEIAPGVAHVVAWAVDGGEEDRRHWHQGCWNGRRTRTITRRWS